MRSTLKNNRLSGLKNELRNEDSPERNKKPNLLFLGLGLAGLVGQYAVNRYVKKRIISPAFGVWGPVFLLLGLYNKMAKLKGQAQPLAQQHTLH